MSGLLSQFSEFAKTPEGQGLLSAAFGGLAGAQRGAPLNSIGRAGMAGLAGYSGALDRQTQEGERAFQQQQRTMQMDDLKRRQAKDAAQQDWRTKLPGLMNDPTALQQHALDPNSPFADELLKERVMPKKPEAFTLSPGQQRFEGGTKVAELPDKVNYNELIIPDGKGGYVINSLYLGAKRQVAAAGRPSVTVNNRVENKAAESVAGQVGPLLRDSLTSAEGATRVGDAANRVIKALDSGKVITGPLTNARVTGLQVADMFGIGGADEKDRLLETRKVIRGLSEMTLQGRKEMSGQGAITDKESALAEKATSGDINALTAAEIRELAAASTRAAKYMKQKHKSRVESARNLPGMGGVADFYDVPDMQEDPAISPTPAASMRFNPATGKLEQVR